MSARFTTTIEGEEFEVEIDRDGTLSFLEYPNLDLEYESIMAALGNTRSEVLMKLIEAWNRNPIPVIADIIITNLPYLSYRDATFLVADWAEHVLPIFENGYPGDFRPRNAIQAARDFVDGKINRQSLEVAVNAARMSSWISEVAEAAEIAAGAAGDLHKWSIKEVSYRAIEGSKNQEQERAWQVRRFVDCMEAVQAGKPWPPLEATE